MFYPKCPRCGCATKSIEPDTLDRQLSHAAMRLRFEAAALNRHHPFQQAAQIAFIVGRQIYKRVRGEKRCTVCRHQFR